MPGASWEGGEETRFSLFSANATAVELCLFSAAADAQTEERRLELSRVTPEGRWELSVPGCGPGQRYGYRVHGPYEPGRGDRFNPAKLLADPCAGAFDGELVWDGALYGAAEGGEDRRPDRRDSAPFVPRSLVVDERFDWQSVEAPAVPWAETVIYECHVRGMTRLHPQLPKEQRGTYLGLSSEPVLRHLRRLGVTAVELLPVQQIAPEAHLLRTGGTNYFGYSPLGFFAPHAGYAAGGAGRVVSEFKRMVRRFHRAGIEVLVDVVLNHTAEGDHRGPTLGLRGIDNRSYYLLAADDPAQYKDYTGCGNTLDLGSAPCRQLVLDALRYWVGDLHVDGFRFDLGTVLGRQRGTFSADAELFAAIRNDPVLSRAKLIAEPWDLGPRGYRLGGFPAEWAEWNDRFRDGVRAFWRGDAGTARGLRNALAGSPGIFTPPRPARASVNFVTAHDGFTLADLVSYEQKNNWANGEENRDGQERNLSRNWGIEGPTDLPRVRELRLRVRRSLLATLALSHGTPMLGHGDEFGRTQGGNNNAYCQDNETTWVHWPQGEADGDLTAFVSELLALRHELALDGPAGFAAAEIRWLSAAGTRLSPPLRPLPYFAALLPVRGGGDPLLILFNGDHLDHLFRLPGAPGSGSWRQLINTADPRRRTVGGASVLVSAHSLVALDRGGLAL